MSEPARDGGITLEGWTAAEKRIDAEQVPDGRPIAERLPLEFLESLTPAEALALRYDPRTSLRPRQIAPATDPIDPWLVAVFLAGRGWGKTHAAAAWLANEVLTNRPATPAIYGLVAPTLQDVWTIQVEALRAWLPPWVRCVERRTHDELVFPDHGVTLRAYSAQSPQLRGPNLRGAWCTELVKWSRGADLFRNLRLAVRVPHPDGSPPQIVCDTTPPQELGWILALCTEPTTRVIRGGMRSNPHIDQRVVDAAYNAMGNTPSAQRELGGLVVLGADRALVSVETVEGSRVASAPPLESIVLGVDPALSGSRESDATGLVVAGIAQGHLYILRSCAEQLEPEEWSARAVRWVSDLHVGRVAVEHATGSGGAVARAVLSAEMRIAGVSCPIFDSQARGAKRDRAQPLAALFSRGRVHLVGAGHDQLVRDLTQWEPGCNWSPGALDAAVHACALLTHGWALRL